MGIPPFLPAARSAEAWGQLGGAGGRSRAQSGNVAGFVGASTSGLPTGSGRARAGRRGGAAFIDGPGPNPRMLATTQIDTALGDHRYAAAAGRSQIQQRHASSYPKVDPSPGALDECHGVVAFSTEFPDQRGWGSSEFGVHGARHVCNNVYDAYDLARGHRPAAETPAGAARQR